MGWSSWVPKCFKHKFARKKKERETLYTRRQQKIQKFQTYTNKKPENTFESLDKSSYIPVLPVYIKATRRNKGSKRAVEQDLQMTLEDLKDKPPKLRADEEVEGISLGFSTKLRKCGIHSMRGPLYSRRKVSFDEIHGAKIHTETSFPHRPRETAQ